MMMKSRKKVLFFDTYIVDSVKYSGPDEERGRNIDEVRNGSYAYRYRSKLDIVKYTLLSYSIIDWDDVVIRFECENNRHSSIFYNFVSKLFPMAKISNTRSDTAKKFLDALLELEGNNYQDPWIFFSPNNDHPYLATPPDFDSVIQEAEDIEIIFPKRIVSILYSHFTEGVASISPSQYLWGHSQFNLPNILGETERAFIVENTGLMSDSIKLWRLSTLLMLFKHNKNDGRVIRLEDLDSYASKKFKEITIAPKIELCRHYDSYTEMLNTTPPLFIPNGIFDKKIKIRYGYSDILDGCVNINPFGRYSFLKDGDADLKCLLNQIPFFWKDRIETVDISADIANIEHVLNYRLFSYYREVSTYRDRPKFLNYIKSFFTYFRVKLIIPMKLTLNFFYRQ
jgi:hypothetical protein